MGLRVWISSVKLSSTDSTPDGISIDQHTQLLYYTDTGRKTISVMTFNGRFHATLISKGLGQPRAIAINPDEG